MNAIRQHFEHEAADFDGLIVTLIPDYHRMVTTLVAILPFDRAAPIRVLDLGCGTGMIGRAVLDVFTHAQLTCVDIAPAMIARARTKLPPDAQARYLVTDFATVELEEQFDAVVSSLALHHLPTDEDKRGVFEKIHGWLTVGGVFYNADVVLGSNNFLQQTYMDEWRRFMARSVSPEEIDGVWIPRYLAEDRPAPLVDQLAWLTEAGFRDVDVVWKYFNFAVYGGTKD